MQRNDQASNQLASFIDLVKRNNPYATEEFNELVRTNPSFISSTFEGLPILHFVATHGCTTLFKRLVDEFHLDPKIPHAQQTVLNIAAFYNRVDIVDFLISKDIYQHNPYDIPASAIRHAVINDSLETVMLLLCRFTPTQTESNSNLSRVAYIQAVKHGKIRIYNNLINLWVNPTFNNNDIPLILLAIRHNQMAMWKIIIERVKSVIALFSINSYEPAKLKSVIPNLPEEYENLSPQQFSYLEAARCGNLDAIKQIAEYLPENTKYSAIKTTDNDNALTLALRNHDINLEQKFELVLFLVNQHSISLHKSLYLMTPSTDNYVLIKNVILNIFSSCPLSHDQLPTAYNESINANCVALSGQLPNHAYLLDVNKLVEFECKRRITILLIAINSYNLQIPARDTTDLFSELNSTINAYAANTSVENVMQLLHELSSVIKNFDSILLYIDNIIANPDASLSDKQHAHHKMADLYLLGYRDNEFAIPELILDCEADRSFMRAIKALPHIEKCKADTIVNLLDTCNAFLGGTVFDLSHFIIHSENVVLPLRYIPHEYLNIFMQYISPQTIENLTVLKHVWGMVKLSMQLKMQAEPIANPTFVHMVTSFNPLSISNHALLSQTWNLLRAQYNNLYPRTNTDHKETAATLYQFSTTLFARSRANPTIMGAAVQKRTHEASIETDYTTAISSPNKR